MKNKFISCLNCKERYVGCHSTCEKYLNEKAAHDEEVKLIRQQRELEDMFIGMKVKEIIKKTRG